MNYYTIRSKPCKYRGRVYRSRHEARWAVFFEKIGIKAEYEPSDFKGWSPDFLIMADMPVYIEIKPYLSYPLLIDYSDKICDSIGFKTPCYEHATKALICTTPIERTITKDLLFGFQVCPFQKIDPILWKYDFDVSSKEYSWHGIFSGNHSKNFIEYNSIESKKLEAIWNESANKVQFLKP